jgi:Asp-tRNA(Asn)/Glu-tRNA(Gln) amidotransferase A subunit family amidase
VLSVPIGLVHGLPVGLALVGTAGSEPSLLRLARGIELALGLTQDGAFLPPL